MATLTQRLKNIFRPLKRIRNEIGAVKSEIAALQNELRNQIAYNILRDSSLAYKDKALMAFYPHCGGKVGTTSDFATMKAYLNAVRPVHTKHLVRVGGPNDGGYVMINPKLDLLDASIAHICESATISPPQELDNKHLIDFSNPPFAISLGVSPYSPWDLDMANFGYKVLQYDASIAKAPYNHPNITFFQKFVGARDSHDTIAFERIIKENHLSPNACNVLQCDIEDCEWEILEQVDLGEMAKYFPQVLFEFHECRLDNAKFAKRRLAVLEQMKAHYTPIHTHFNNCGAVYYANGYFWGAVVEVSYLRNDLVDKSAKMLSGVGNSCLDAPNAPTFPDILVIFDDF